MSRVTVYLTLLRAINLPGHNKVAMTELRELLEFQDKAQATAELERVLEAEVVDRTEHSGASR